MPTIDEPPGPLGSGTERDPRLVVEAWLAVPSDDGWHVLLLRRTPRSGGFWQGVSGRVEACDASFRAAALREIREETGLALGVEVTDLGRTSEFRGLMTGAWFRKRSLGALLPRGVSSTTVALSEEHDAAEVVTFEEARRRVRFPENRVELEVLERSLPAARALGGADGGPRA